MIDQLIKSSWHLAVGKRSNLFYFILIDYCNNRTHLYEYDVDKNEIV